MQPGVRESDRKFAVSPPPLCVIASKQGSVTEPKITIFFVLASLIFIIHMFIYIFHLLFNQMPSYFYEC